MPINLNRIDHIAMAVEDLDAQAAILESLFGFERERTWEDAEERGISFRIGASDLRWEVVAPAGDRSPLRAFLDSPRGPGVHHVGMEVGDLDAAAEVLASLGVTPGEASDTTRLVIEADGGGEGTEFHLLAGDAHPHATEARRTEASKGAPSVGIDRLDHVCTAYPDRDELSEHYQRLFGMRQIWITHEGAAPDFCDAVLEIPIVDTGRRQPAWEVIQPLGSDSFIQTFLDRRGPAVHHVAFEVADFDAAKSACEAHGIPTFDEHDDSTDGLRWRDLFIHPRYTGGLLTQLFWEEAPMTWVRSDKVRPPGFEA